VPPCRGGVSMARKVGQIVRRGDRTWLVRVYNGRDPESRKRKYLNQTVHGGLRDAQSQLNKMLSERDRGRNPDSSKQTLNRYHDSAVPILHVAPRELAEFIGGRSTAPAACQVPRHLPRRFRVRADQQAIATTPQSAMQLLRRPHPTREERRHRHLCRHVMREPKQIRQ
jgi:hypothetical protein